jgi:hypothetical protein
MRLLQMGPFLSTYEPSVLFRIRLTHVRVHRLLKGLQDWRDMQHETGYGNILKSGEVQNLYED